MINIGIDCGVSTGYAVTGMDGKLSRVCSYTITTAMDCVLHVHEVFDGYIKVYIEDARQRTWVTGGREKLQGVGSVKRDAQIWETFCLENDINFEMVAPKNNRTKLSAEQFKRLTGWTGRTNEHARDAAMLVWGRR